MEEPPGAKKYKQNIFRANKKGHNCLKITLRIICPSCCESEFGVNS
jgi:hypothetical protein